VKKLLILLLLSGCASWTQQQKKTAWVATGFIVAAYVIREQGKDPAAPTTSCFAIIPAGPQVPGQPAQVIIQNRFC